MKIMIKLNFQHNLALENPSKNKKTLRTLLLRTQMMIVTHRNNHSKQIKEAMGNNLTHLK